MQLVTGLLPCAMGPKGAGQWSLSRSDGTTEPPVGSSPCTPYMVVAPITDAAPGSRI